MFLPKNESSWRNALEYLNDTMKFYGNWYGKYPYSKMTAVDGDLSSGGGMEYPNITIVNSAGIPNFIRIMEVQIMHETGHQWFYGILGSNEMDEAWLDEGINAYSEIRYMEAKYGKYNGDLLSKGTFWLSPFITRKWATDRTLANIFYFTTAINNYDEPILKPAYKFREIQTYALVYQKTAWVMDMLNYLVGEERFNKIMQTYYEKWKFKHPTTEDFIAVAEEQGGLELDWFFKQWLSTTYKLDYTVGKITNEKEGDKFITKVYVEKKGQAIMPVDVLLITSKGDSLIKRVEGKVSRDSAVFETSSKYKKIVLDPNRRLLDINPINNSSGLPLSASLFFDLPNVYAYQLFYLPIIWWGSKDGFRYGAYIHGEQLLHGKYFFTLSGAYAPKTKTPYIGIDFGSTIKPLSDKTKYTFSYSNAFGREDIRFDLDLFWSKYLDERYSHKLNIRPNLHSVFDSSYYNSGVFSENKNNRFTTIRLEYKYSLRKPKYLNTTNFAVKYGIEKIFGNKYSMSKYSIDSYNTFKWEKNFWTKFRIFTGLIAGPVPHQERFYLAGSVNTENTDKLVLADKGIFSGLEQFQTGMIGLRGFYGANDKDEYPRGTKVLILNIDVKVPKFPLVIFVDIGDIWGETKQSAGQTGLSIKFSTGLTLPLGPLQAHFPIFVSDPPSGKSFRFRWQFTLNVAEIPFLGN
jgi:hypothetical protein